MGPLFLQIEDLILLLLLYVENVQDARFALTTHTNCCETPAHLVSVQNLHCTDRKTLPPTEWDIPRVGFFLSAAKK